MGACFSKADRGGAAPPAPNNNQNQGPNASNNTNQHRHRRGFLGRSSRSTGNTPRASTSSLKPNKPLLPLPEGRCQLPDPYIVPTSHGGKDPGGIVWTREALERERNDWWDTHSTTGNPQVWATYREIIKCLQQGKVKEAQALLDAAGCTCPDGKAWVAIFDERGRLYNIRDVRGSHNYDYVVFEPEGLVDGDAVAQREKEEQQDVQVEGKGKGKAVVRDDEELGELLQMRCKVGPVDKEYVIEARERDKIGVIKAKLSPILGAPVSRIKVSYLGHVYEDHQPLRNWKRGNALTVGVLSEGPGQPSIASGPKDASTGQSSETLIIQTAASEQPPRIPTPEQHPPLTAPGPRSPTPASDRPAPRPINEQQPEATSGNPLRKSVSSS